MERSPRYKLLTDPSSSFNIQRTGHLYELESVNHSVLPEQLEGIKRNRITTFSKASRRRMIQKLSRLGDRKAIFATCTYDDPMPTVEEAKTHLDRLLKRIQRKFPGYISVWRLEFQPKSGRPHFHMLIYGPDKTPFIPHQWLKAAWRQVTGRDSLRPEVKGMRSHRGGMYYASKYLCKEDEEGFEKYRRMHPGTKVGRFWGISGSKHIPDSADVTALSADDYKWLTLHMAKDKAERSIKRELRKKGKTYDEIEADSNSPGWDRCVLEQARMMFVGGGFPTWISTDDLKYIDRTVRLSKNSHTDADIDYVFRFC